MQQARLNMFAMQKERGINGGTEPRSIYMLSKILDLDKLAKNGIMV